MDLDHSEDIKARGTDRFQKQIRAEKIEPIKISKRLDKALNQTKYRNTAAKEDTVKYDIAEGLSEKLHHLTLEEEYRLVEQRDFELYGPYYEPSDDSSSHFSFGSSSGEEDEFSGDNRPHTQEFSDSEESYYSQETSYSGELSDSSDHFDGFCFNSTLKDKIVEEKQNQKPCDLTDEKNVHKNKSHKSYLSHQKDKQELVNKKVLAFAFSGVHRKGGHHSRFVYNIGREEKRILDTYQQSINPIEIAEQPKERARDINKRCKK